MSKIDDVVYPHILRNHENVKAKAVLVVPLSTSGLYICEADED